MCRSILSVKRSIKTIASRPIILIPPLLICPIASLQHAHLSVCLSVCVPACLSVCVYVYRLEVDDFDRPLRVRVLSYQGAGGGVRIG